MSGKQSSEVWRHVETIKEMQTCQQQLSYRTTLSLFWYAKVHSRCSAKMSGSETHILAVKLNANADGNGLRIRHIVKVQFVGCQSVCP